MDVVAIVRLTVLIDEIAIAAAIPVILMAIDDGTHGSAEDSAHDCACARTDAGKHRTRESAHTCAYDRSSGSPGYRMVIPWVGCATTESETARGDCRNEKAFHGLSSRNCLAPAPRASVRQQQFRSRN